MGSSFLLSIDQGTSSTKTLVFNGEGKIVSRASEPVKTYFGEGGFVEQDPEDLYRNVLTSVEKCIGSFKTQGENLGDIKVCGISNQRETFVVWNGEGVPLYPAVVWQCKRSVNICERLKKDGLQDIIKTKTGLVIDPYFSGSKLIWLYENIDRVRHAVDEGKAYFGTIDTWLLFKLTNGKTYLTDFTNASRTLLFNLSTLTWDRDLLSLFGLSNLNLPGVKPSSYLFGNSDFDGIFTDKISIASMIGDSHAAAFGEGCFSRGTAKATLGTGCSVLMNIGDEAKPSGRGMVTTICWSTEERVDFALEGVIVSCGSVIEWLKNELGLFMNSTETESMANAVSDNNGVYLVPAFSGLGAPYWDMTRKASISGLTFDCNKKHIVRAALESIAYQVKDVIAAMQQDTGISLQQLMVNGGLTANKFMLQFLSDLLERPVINMGMPDVSALGAAYLAGLKMGVYKDLDHLKTLNSEKSFIHPGENSSKVKSYYSGWQQAVGSYEL